MSYQVLARKWRPRSFADMVGQAHVVRALSNGLDQDRLHHAYLFTGTRGVGKTTLARILSKALNCEEGVSAKPCGRCGACCEIDEGRFVDLLEVDAASRTKVDQTRELLDNVPFAPVKGRFKVYLIDEVHMFSASSFNALLKTLEEPPPHVKFLLATTDPQKVPVTVLSRCLQFNLKRLLPEEISAQLGHILRTEGIEFEAQVLPLLARAADGSMRDGLSLLDQAIAYGGGRVGTDEIRAMLGTVDREMSLNLVRALAELDAVRLLDEVARIHELTPDFGGLLQEMLVLLHRIALFQQVPATLTEDDPERGDLAALAEMMDPEDLQLYYQIALQGQQDLALAPDARTGMEMVLLRMLAFRPDAGGDDEGVNQGGSSRVSRPSAGGAVAAPPREPSRQRPTDSSGSRRERGPSAADQAAEHPGSGQQVSPTSSAASAMASTGHPATAALAAARLAVGSEKPAATHHSNRQGPGPAERVSASPSGVGPRERPSIALRGKPGLSNREHWHALVARLDLGGVASELAFNCELGAWDGSRLVLTLDPASQGLRVAVAERRLRESLACELGEGFKLEIQVSQPIEETPSQRHAREQSERQASAESAMQTDPVVETMRSELGARFIPGTVGPTEDPST